MSIYVCFVLVCASKISYILNQIKIVDKQSVVNIHSPRS